MKTILSVPALLVAAGVMAGCTNAGGELAQAGRDYAVCQLVEGAQCKLAPPQGATVEKATYAAPNDALRISGGVASELDCKSFVANAHPGRRDIVLQAVVNGTVVSAYGDVKRVQAAVDAAESACATGPYRVSLTVAKAPLP